MIWNLNYTQTEKEQLIKEYGDLYRGIRDTLGIGIEVYGVRYVKVFDDEEGCHAVVETGNSCD